MMAPWLKVRCDLHEDPAVISAASRLGVGENEVVGALVKLWSWANRQTADGNAAGVTTQWLDRYVGVANFSAALAEAGWLVVTEGGFAIPNFDRHNGSIGKGRAQTLARVNKSRGKTPSRHQDAPACNAGAVTSAPPPGVSCNGASVTKSLPDEEEEREKRREENPPLAPPRGGIKPQPASAPSARKKRPPPTEWDGVLPAGLDVPEFRAVWETWEQDRRQRRCGLTPAAREKQWAMCLAAGVPDAIRSINQSIAGGYQGLFPPRPGTLGDSEVSPAGRAGPRRKTAEEMFPDLVGLPTNRKEERHDVAGVVAVVH
jgi:hypothetical protein